jgi:phage repressor protein C with HTH and peptisase S24 domain
VVDKVLPSMGAKRSYSARELAEMRLPHLPATKKGWYDLFKREGWEMVLVAGGRGCKGGLCQEYIPSPDVAALIAARAGIASAGKSDVTETQEETPAKTTQYLVAEKPPIQFVREQPNGSEHEIAIDKYVNVKGAAGVGQEVQDEAIVQVRIDARLLRERVGNNFGSIKIASVSGDSMEPTMSHGDQVLIDTSCTTFIDDAVYAIQQDGFLRFKRIQKRLDGSIIVKSDNPVNGPETYTAEEAQYFKVIGVVIPFKFGRFKL